MIINEIYYVLFDYLYLREEPHHSNVIVGLGSFDLKVPERCAKLHRQGFGEIILFSGGIGNGSADLEEPEALVYKEFIQRHYPKIPGSDIFIESKSSNTGENLEFSEKLMKESAPSYDLGNYEISTVLVTQAARQRRAALTWKKHFPKSTFWNCPPKTTYKEEKRAFSQKGLDQDKFILDEIQKIIEYPDKGFIAQEEVPEIILDLYNFLKEREV